jgi:hypothetical protein
MKTCSDLILIFGVSVEECLNFQLAHSATQGVPEPSLKPKIKTAKSLSYQF